MSAEDLGDLLKFDEELPHPDEKWLVSYADMMTLLFGFFVMLYSMVNKMDVVEKSVAQKFSATPVESEQAPAPVKNQLGNEEDLTAKVAGLEKALAEAQARAAAMEKSSRELEDRLFTQSDSLMKSGQLAQQLKSVTEERDKLRSQLAQAQTEALMESSQRPARRQAEKMGGGSIGGGGSRGSKERIGGSGGIKLKMPVRFENGFTATTVGATNRGLVLDRDAPGAPGETFVATVEGPDGRAIKAVVKIMMEHGDSRHLGIIHYLSGDERHLKEWIANAP